ncbi:Gfo/Idh/MocA family protein [Anaeromyxobacter oryzae]|uniref:Dehydrogenase n=1 Tax=Anaeromyxobacter oryzae TaxID=2918170 RepID=A0ABN6MPF8_9BACT|nr:Gfo/Idh/MocA family oxidoreductase [Anaeromyxobacter oryzae]BDG02891.1 dehydrogenase [Anaeromyxobacter oryzae]
MRPGASPTACIVGAGFVGPAHVEALRRNGVEVRALVGADEERAQRSAAELGIPRAYGSLGAALDASGADVYHLAVPNALHAPFAREVMAAGRHVVCEKPLALTSSESAELVELEKKAGVVAAVAYNLRFYPLVCEARERIRAGALGKVHAVHGSYLQDWLLHDTDWNWRLDPAQGGALRVVADIGTHWLDLVSWTTGSKVSRVLADFSTVHPTRRRPRGEVLTFSGGAAPVERENVAVSTEDQAAILLRLENGALGSVVVSQVSAGRKNALSFQVDGGTGSLAWSSEEPNHLWLGHRERPNEILEKDPSLLSAAARARTAYPGGHQEGYPDTFRQLFSSVYAYVAGGDFAAPRDFPTFADGHREMLLCNALLESSRTGRWVELPG